MDLETKKLPVTDFKATSDIAGTFTGYVAVFNNLDGNGDVIEPGAFTKTLATAREFKAQTRTPYLYPLLWQHDETEPIGGVTDASEDTNGLYIKGQYDLDTDLGRRAYSGAKMGYLTGLSIGYRTVKSMVSRDGARHLVEIALFEASPVTFPANDRAQITSVKARSAAYRTTVARSDDELARELEYQLAIMTLESKAASIQSRLGDATLADETKQRQERWQAELRLVHERHALERKARARGERVPSLYSDPTAYAAWLKNQRMLPYTELGQRLNKQSR
jgi:HK97 family phage prohead protease